MGGPLANVCGLPILVRTLLVLQRGGIERTCVLVEPAHRAAIEGALVRHARVRVPFAIVEGTGDSLAPMVAALADRPAGTEVVVWPAALSLGRRAPAWCEIPAGGMLCGQDPASGRDSGLVLSTVGVLRAHPDLSIPVLAESLAAEGRLGRVPLPQRPVSVVDRVTIRLAERELLASLRKDADGVVARFDRYVSLFISRHLMALPIKPSHVTVVAALVGILCGLLVAHGGYAWMLLGALAFQLNSILDGVDGEIARAKLLESWSGQWFDTLADDLANLSFMVGVSVGSYRTWGSSAYLALGAIASAGFLITSTIMYHFLLTRAHSGDLNDFVMPWKEGSAPGPECPDRAAPLVARFLARVQCVFRRDAYVFLCTLAGIAGQLRFMAWLFAVGTTAVWASIVLYRALVPPLARERSEGA